MDCVITLNLERLVNAVVRVCLVSAMCMSVCVCVCVCVCVHVHVLVLYEYVYVCMNCVVILL